MRWPQNTTGWKYEEVGSWAYKHGVGEKVRAGEINVKLTRILIAPEAMRLDDITKGMRVYRKEEIKD